ncbi:MAG: hypothetical protein ACI90U_002257 [Pseudomonadales bacterium]|jgi:hypothetical protein
MILTNIKKGLAATIATSLLAVSVSAPVNAAVGTTTISVTLNPFVILYYYSDISFEISAVELAQLVDGTPTAAACTPTATDGACVDDGTEALGVQTISELGDGSVSATAHTGGAGSNSISVEINNAWAVRSLATTLTAGVAGPATLTGGGGSIAISNGATNDTGSTAGLAIQQGDIVFDMDITNATGATAAYTGDFIITVAGM